VEVDALVSARGGKAAVELFDMESTFNSET